MNSNLSYNFSKLYDYLRVNLKSIGNDILSADLTINLLNDNSNSFRLYMKKVHNIDLVICKFTRKEHKNNYYAIYQSKQSHPLQYYHNVGDTFYWVYTKSKYKHIRKQYELQSYRTAIQQEFANKFFKL